jgi:methylglutaconyl-CoA hydratase
VRNAFNESVIGELAATFAGFAADGVAARRVLGGRGKSFCAGADLGVDARDGRLHLGAEPRRRAGAGRHAVGVYSCPVPVIGRIHGDCLCRRRGLAAVCDVLVAADAASFCLSEAKLGPAARTISPYVVRALGEQASRRYFVTAERFQRRAGAGAGPRACGVPARRNRRQGRRDRRRHRRQRPMAVRACKRLVQGRWPADRSLRRCATTRRGASPTSAPAPKGREGVQSFLGKRSPTWPARMSLR